MNAKTKSHGMKALSVLGLTLAGTLLLGSAQAATTLTVAAFPSLDSSIKAILPAWNKLHPDVTIKLQAQQYADHHNAMTTALATGQGLPDVMAIEIAYVGKFAEG